MLLFDSEGVCMLCSIFRLGSICVVCVCVNKKKRTFWCFFLLISQQHFLFLLPWDRFKLMVSLVCWAFWAFCNNLCFSTFSVIVRNISSTFKLSLADVSNNWMSICLAKRWASSVITTFESGSSFLLPTAINIKRIKLILIRRSGIWPGDGWKTNLPKTLLTTSQLCSISCSHRLTLANDSPFVTS